MTTLPDTTLAALVRNELQNPAGGITRFARSVLPHVPRAIIADTGSTDGTRDALADLQREYPHLTVLDIPFTGFADVRNRMFSHVKTKYTLILDADEIIPQSDYAILAQDIAHARSSTEWYLGKQQIMPDGSKGYVPVQLVNLFTTKGLSFIGRVDDGPTGIFRSSRDSAASVIHFLPSEEAITAKIEWYAGLDKTIDRGPQDDASIDARIKTYLEEHDTANAPWKAYNPQRDKYD